MPVSENKRIERQVAESLSQVLDVEFNTPCTVYSLKQWGTSTTTLEVMLEAHLKPTSRMLRITIHTDDLPRQAYGRIEVFDRDDLSWEPLFSIAGSLLEVDLKIGYTPAYKSADLTDRLEFYLEDLGELLRVGTYTLNPVD